MNQTCQKTGEYDWPGLALLTHPRLFIAFQKSDLIKVNHLSWGRYKFSPAIWLLYYFPSFKEEFSKRGKL